MDELKEEVEELREYKTENENRKKFGGLPEEGTQTALTGVNQQFYLLEYPALMTEVAIEQELEDLNAC